MSKFPQGKFKTLSAVFILSGVFLLLVGIKVVLATPHTPADFTKTYNDTLNSENWNELLGYSTSTGLVYSGNISLGNFVNTWLPATMLGPLGINIAPGLTQLTIRSSGSNVLDLLNSSGTNLLTVLNNGNVGIGTTAPNDIFSIGNGGLAAPAGSSLTGHNFTPTYMPVLNDPYALANVSYVQSVADAINLSVASSTLWSGIKNGNIWNGTAGAGNVGIGTTDPTTLLQLSNNNWISAKNYAGTGAVNMFKVNASDQIEVGAALNIGSFEFSPDSGLVTFVDMPVTAASASGTPESYVFKIDGDNIMGVYSESNGLGGVQNKRVGIGTISPAATLDVNGSFKSTSATVSALGSSGNVVVMADDSGTLYNTPLSTFISSNTLWSGARNGNIWNGDAGLGNVGIGTTNPQSILDVYSTKVGGDTIKFKNGNTADYMFIGVTNNSNKQLAMISYGDTQPGTILGNSRGGAAVVLGYNNPSSLLIGTFGDQPVVFGRNNAEVMRLAVGGNVGIGTTTPSQKLHVAGGAQFDSVSYGATPISAQTLALTTVEYVNAKVGGSGGVETGISGQTLRHDGTSWIANSIIFNNGTNVGIGTTNPGASLDVAGANGIINAFNTRLDALGGSGNSVVMADVSGNLYSTSTSSFISSNNIGSSVYVGTTAAAVNGNNNAVPGYDASFALCETAYTGSHVCTPDDMLANIKIGTIYPAVNVWIFAGPPGYTASANDCNGRRGIGSSDLGAYWEALSVNYPKGRGLLMACNQSLKIACCK